MATFTSTRNPSTERMLDMLSLSLASQQEPFPSDSKKLRGAVGVFIKEEADDLWLLMIRRRDSPQDPWSGQMAFPGGHADEADRTLFETVAREAMEEVGIDARRQKFLGCLRNVEPRNAPMIVTPFIFLLKEKVHPRTSLEAQEIVWIPASSVSDQKNISSMTAPIGGDLVSMGCYRYSNHIIWGMSFRIIRDIVSRMTTPQ